MASRGIVVSRHYLRRRARAKAARLERKIPREFVVERTERGPYRWRVVQRPL